MKISYQIALKQLKNTFKTNISLDIKELETTYYNDEIYYLSLTLLVSNDDMVFFVAIDEENKKALGVLTLSYRENGLVDEKTGEKYQWHMSSISVDESAQNQGIAKTLIKNMFEFCSTENIHDVLQTEYSEEGADKVLPVFDRIKKEYPNVNFVDHHFIYEE